MTIAAVCSAFKSIGNGTTITISSDTFTIHAFDPPPAETPDTAQLPCQYVMTRGATYPLGFQTANEMHELRDYEICIGVLPDGQATPTLIETRCRPILAAMRSLYASYVLDSVTGAYTVFVKSDTGPIQLPEYPTLLGFKVVVTVEEIIERIIVG